MNKEAVIEAINKFEEVDNMVAYIDSDEGKHAEIIIGTNGDAIFGISMLIYRLSKDADVNAQQVLKLISEGVEFLENKKGEE